MARNSEETWMKLVNTIYMDYRIIHTFEMLEAFLVTSVSTSALEPINFCAHFSVFLLTITVEVNLAH